jgi:hypothetical protein
MLFVGDDWAEDDHDVELVDEAATGWPRHGRREGSTASPGCTG